MKEQDETKIEKIIRDRKSAHDSFLKGESKTYKAFLALENAAFSSGELDRLHKELIALGISIVINCESCMERIITMEFQ